MGEHGAKTHLSSIFFYNFNRIGVTLAQCVACGSSQSGALWSLSSVGEQTLDSRQVIGSNPIGTTIHQMMDSWG